MPRKGGNKRSGGKKGGGQAWAARNTTSESLACSDADATKIPEGNKIGEMCRAEESVMQTEAFGLLGMACDMEVAKKLEDGCLACSPADVDKPSVLPPVSAASILSNPVPSLPGPILSSPSKGVGLPTQAEGSRLAHLPQQAGVAMMAAKEEEPEVEGLQQFADIDASSTGDQNRGTASVDRAGPPPPSAFAALDLVLPQPAPMLAPLEAPELPAPALQEQAQVQTSQPLPEDGRVHDGEDSEARPLTFCERCCGRALRRQLDAPLLRGGR